MLFNIRLAATPATSDEFGQWQRVDVVDDMKPESAPRAPKADESFEIRYRVPKD